MAVSDSITVQENIIGYKPAVGCDESMQSKRSIGCLPGSRRKIVSTWANGGHAKVIWEVPADTEFKPAIEVAGNITETGPPMGNYFHLQVIEERSAGSAIAVLALEYQQESRFIPKLVIPSLKEVQSANPMNQVLGFAGQCCRADHTKIEFCRVQGVLCPGMVAKTQVKISGIGPVIRIK